MKSSNNKSISTYEFIQALQEHSVEDALSMFPIVKMLSIFNISIDKDIQFSSIDTAFSLGQNLEALNMKQTVYDSECLQGVVVLISGNLYIILMGDDKCFLSPNQIYIFRCNYPALLRAIKKNLDVTSVQIDKTVFLNEKGERI